MKILAIDPGTWESGFVVWDGSKVLHKGKVENKHLLGIVMIPFYKDINTLVIEQIRSYGNAMGQSTIDTVFWSGRFAQAFNRNFFLLPRMEIKKHLCDNHRAKDSNVIQALVDRFAYGKKNRGKGTIKEPGFFYGFKADIWQAMAVAVTWYDQNA